MVRITFIGLIIPHTIQTLICPHKQFASDMTIQLPPNTTHVKLSRPELLLSTLISEDSEEE